MDVVGELRGVVAVVMKVQLYLAEAVPGEPAERSERLRGVLLPGEEERVARRAPVGISKFACEDRIVLLPACDALSALRCSGPTPERLVVVAHREEHVTRSLDARRRHPAERVATVAAK